MDSGQVHSASYNTLFKKNAASSELITIEKGTEILREG